MVCSDNLKLNCLLETQEDFRDFYYLFCKKYGHFDYLKDLVFPDEKEYGIRLDIEHNYPLTVKTRNIMIENQINLIGQIRYLTQNIS